MPVIERLSLPGFKIIRVFCDVAPTFKLSNRSDKEDRLMAGPLTAEKGLTRRMR